MTSESAYPELTTLKVVHNGIARRVKIPYDMDWKDFERKVCRLFNLAPPLITSYKDSMGVSVLVDNSEDFFFFLDEEYTGRLDIVILDLPESSDWTVVRTDTGKALKEAEDPSEISVDEVHAINSPLTNTTRGSTIESPLFTSTKEHPELKSNYAESDKDEESIRSDKSITEELPESIVNAQTAQNEINSKSPVGEEVGSIYEDSEEVTTKETIDVIEYTEPTKGELVTVEDEGDIEDESSQSEAKEEFVAEAAQSHEAPITEASSIVNNRAISDILANDNEFNTSTLEKKSILSEAPSSSEPLPKKATSPENSIFSIDSDLGFFKDLISDIMPKNFSDAIDNCLSNSNPRADVVGTRDSVSNISKSTSSKVSKPEILFEDDASRVTQPVSIISERDIPVDQNDLTTSESFVQADSVKQIQDLRQLCFRFGDSLRRHPSLLTTVELFTDQLSHGVPINIAVLEAGLNRLASSSESNITPSEAFEELATNLAGSVSQLVQHVGNAFSSFIERDVTPLVNSCSHQTASPQVVPEAPQNLSSSGLGQSGTLELNSHDEKPSFSKESDSHRSRRHRCRHHRDINSDVNGGSDEIGSSSFKNKSTCSKTFHSHPRRHARDSWLGKSSRSEHVTASKVDISKEMSPNLKDTSQAPLNSAAGVSTEQTPMKEKFRPVSLTKAPQLIPYYINQSVVHSKNCPTDSHSPKLLNTNSLQTSMLDRKPQPYHFSRNSEPYRPLSFNDSIGVDPFSGVSLDTFSSQDDRHRAQTCPPKPMDVPMPDENTADLGAEIDPADVALIEGLVTLRSMGFHDDTANMEALQLNSSIVEAVDYLLSR